MSDINKFLLKKINETQKEVNIIGKKILALKRQRQILEIERPFFFASDVCGVNIFFKELEIYKDYAITYINQYEQRKHIRLPEVQKLVGSGSKTSWFVWKQKIKQIFYVPLRKKDLELNLELNLENEKNKFHDYKEFVQKHNELYENIENIGSLYQINIDKINKQIKGYQKLYNEMIDFVFDLKNKIEQKNKKIDFNFYDSENDPMPF